MSKQFDAGDAAALYAKLYHKALAEKHALAASHAQLLAALKLMCRSRGALNPIPAASHYAAAYAAIAEAEKVQP